MIFTWHHLIGGFTQGLGAPTGLERLWLEMRPLSSPACCIQLWTWRDDFEAVAGFIRRNSGPAPAINIYAYSWGAGVGFIALAEALGKLGMRVARAVLCDPVYRSRVLPDWLPCNPLSLTDFPKLQIPDNVEVVRWTHQTVNRPRGHRPTPTGRNTIIEPGLRLQLPHEKMDDAAEFHALALATAKGEL